MSRTRLACLVVWLWVALPGATAQSADKRGDYFRITVLDDQTGRGVPLVELKTVNHATFYTDSNGIIALLEPSLLDQSVFFHIKSHGYEFPKDGFGFRGKALRVSRGGSAVLKIKRLNIAERLYRVTGEAIYRDSFLVGAPVPIQAPLLNAQVVGQDSVMAAPYRGMIYWFWGDTERLSYPLGHFATAGARSELPVRGGLDPNLGVDLEYFADTNGFSRPVCPISGEGLKWIDGLFVLHEEQGGEHLIARFMRMKDLGTTLEKGLVRFNDNDRVFERLAVFDVNAPAQPGSHPFPVEVAGERYQYFPILYPEAAFVRVRADLAHVTNAQAYDAFTCLKPGARFDKNKDMIDRGPDGRPVFGWKAGTEPSSQQQEESWIKNKMLRPEEAWFQLRDIQTGAPVGFHSGNVNWNAHRQRWIMIAQAKAGEIWFAQADTPVGPWVHARQIVTHDRYNFYNPAHHAFLDQAGGRLIFFEGTYTDSFSSARVPTPHYNYNQIMYRLDLDDPRLVLPAPVYRVRRENRALEYLMRPALESENLWPRVEAIDFFAIPPEAVAREMVAISAAKDDGNTRLARLPVGGVGPVLFRAVPPGNKAEPALAELYAFRHERTGERLYATEAERLPAGFRREGAPLCQVWKNPTTTLALDWQAKPSP